LRQGTRDSNPLPFTTRQCRDPPIGECQDVTPFQCGFYRRPVCTPWRREGAHVSVAPQEYGFLHGQWEHGLFPLWDDADDTGKLPPVPFSNVLSDNRHTASTGTQYSHQQSEQRSLSTPVGAYDPHQFALPNIQRHACNGVMVDTGVSVSNT
jgi:hypothetical protein